MRSGLTPARTLLFEKFTEEALAAGPWSITYHRPSGLGVNAGPHDYVSEGPYWWPDPKNPGAPYIRKDGQRNPDRFLGNRNDLGSICTAMLSLGIGAYFLKNAACAPRANTVLSTWFLDPKTRMTPHLEHGQLTRGHDDGRGTGLIDTVSFIHLVQGIALMELAGGLDTGVAQGVREWFAAFAKWMTTSQKGLDEKKSGNNHATWWTAQVAAYSSLHRRRRRPLDVLGPLPQLPGAHRNPARWQLPARGSAHPIAQLLLDEPGCFLGDLPAGPGERRGPVESPVDKSFHYLLPYVLDPDIWKKEQITKYSASGICVPGTGGHRRAFQGSAGGVPETAARGVPVGAVQRPADSLRLTTVLPRTFPRTGSR